ncbi:MAG TPA: VOC family protein [Lautropia sp.]|jgi:uncharacterized glyoxalase superfamily protein PhnB|nr:VOC family protein [Lautropia sp.]
MKPPTNPTPPGWPRITPAVYYDDAETAIDWLCNAFGFMVRIKVAGPDGTIVHSELEYGDGLIMVGQTGKEDEGKGAWQVCQVSPAAIDQRNTQSLCMHVDDVDAHCERARTAGARIYREPETTDYGETFWTDRTYGARDPEGHMWWFMQRLKTAGG